MPDIRPPLPPRGPKASAEPDVLERYAGFGYEAWPISAAAMAAAIESDARRYADTIKRLNLQLD